MKNKVLPELARIMGPKKKPTSGAERQAKYQAKKKLEDPDMWMEKNSQKKKKFLDGLNK